MQNDDRSSNGAASSFLEAAGQPIVITAYCPFCWKETKQKFSYEDAVFEYYDCEKCGQKISFAVR